MPTRPTQQPTRAASAPAIGVDEHVVAQQLNLSVHWLRKDRLNRRLLPFYKIGGTVRYNLDRVREALAAMEEGGTAIRPRATSSRRHGAVMQGAAQ